MRRVLLCIVVVALVCGPLAHAGPKANAPGKSTTELLKELQSEDDAVRQAAKKELVRLGDKVQPALLKLLSDTENPLPARVAALEIVASPWNKEVQETLLGLLKDREADLRRGAAEVLADKAPRGGQGIHDALLEMLGDEDHRVRAALFLAMGKINAPPAADALVTTLQFFNAKDEKLYEALLRAIEATGPRGIQSFLVADFSS